MKHRNSQKRIYINDAIYFLTTNVDDPLFLLKENLFCDLFVADLKFCRKIKQFNIFGYKVNPDHIHLLIQPTGINNYSEIMRSLKTNYSRNVNFIMGYNEISEFLKAGSRDPAFKNQYTAFTNTVDPAFKNQDTAFANTVDPVLKNQTLFKNHSNLLYQFKCNFDKKYKNPHFPKFHWQSSFHDHIIRDKSDYYMRLNYIKKQWIQHELPENKYCYISKQKPDLSYTNQLKFVI
ncbi:MAG: transposase [Bacteroidia bacterium]|nr:transposase [Bacteroidia bacterium]